MNKVTVFGATGGTGTQVVAGLREAGVEVNVVVRDPTRYDPPDGVNVRQGDVLDPASLAGAFDGVDAVISTLGPRDVKSPTTVYSSGAANIVEQMRAAGVRRLVVLSAVPVSPPEEMTFFVRHVGRPILWRFFGHGYRDLQAMEAALRSEATDIDWTVVRPPLLVDTPRRGGVRRAVNTPLERPKKISRADLGAELIDIAADESLAHSVVTVSY